MKNKETIPVSPHLGQRWVQVRRQDNGLWSVDVRIFKLNTLRGDAYWTPLAYRTYQKKADAERYAARFED